MKPDSLTETQKREYIIHQDTGPMLVLAGPGAGKTDCIVRRVVQLITDKKARHDEILVITFTNKAAHELRTRIDNQLRKLRRSTPDTDEINLDEMYISTFHSFCERMFSEYPQLRGGYNRNARVLTDAQQVYFIQQHIRTEWTQNKRMAFTDILGCTNQAYIRRLLDLIRRNYYAKKSYLTAHDVAGAICYRICDKLAEEMISPEELLRSADPDEQTLGTLLNSYLNVLKTNQVHVYATLQLTLYQTLKQNPAVLSGKFKYIIVDEYQDTDSIQNEIIELLTTSHNNLMVVGDDDQSIYRFRGARVDNILTFEQRYPGCVKITLSANYRSPQEIVDFYSRWMEQSSVNWKNCRYPKKLKAQKNSAGSVCKIAQNDQNAWMEEIAGFISGLKAGGRITDYNQVVFLSSSIKAPHIQALQKHLQEKDIPVYSPRSGRFLERGEVCLAIGCLLKALGFRNVSHSEYLNSTLKYADHRLAQYPSLSAVIASLSKKLDGIKKYNELLYRMFSQEPFSSWLSQDMRNSSYDELRPARNLAQLTQMIASYEDLNPYITDLKKDAGNFVYGYLRDLPETDHTEYEDEKDAIPSDYVSFMTIHQSKGLQFPIVIVDLPSKVGLWSSRDIVSSMIDSRNPSREPQSDKPLFDEMRRYYTAFSRAQDLLVLSCLNSDASFFSNAIQNSPDLASVKTAISAMTFRSVVPSELTDSFAFTSDIEQYEECPRHYQMNRMLGFAPTAKDTRLTFLGTLVHQTVEDINLFAMNGGEPDPALIKKLRDENAFSLGKANGVRFSEKELETALRHLINYYSYVERHYGKTNPQNKWHNIDAAEKTVSLPCETDGVRYTMKGSIDLIRKYRDYYTIIDIKTGKKDQKKINGYYRQLRIYSHLLRKTAGHREMTMQLFFTGEPNKPVETIRFKNELDCGAIDAELNNYDRIVKQIMDRDFSETAEDDFDCRDCDFRFFCKKVQPV